MFLFFICSLNSHLRSKTPCQSASRRTTFSTLAKCISWAWSIAKMAISAPATPAGAQAPRSVSPPTRPSLPSHSKPTCAIHTCWSRRALRRKYLQVLFTFFFIFLHFCEVPNYSFIVTFLHKIIIKLTQIKIFLCFLHKLT